MKQKNFKKEKKKPIALQVSYILKAGKNKEFTEQQALLSWLLQEDY